MRRAGGFSRGHYRVRSGISYQGVWNQMSETSEEGTSNAHPGHKQHTFQAHRQRCTMHTRVHAHTHTHTRSNVHTLFPQPHPRFGDRVSAGDREKTRPFCGYSISARASLRGWAESTQDPQQLPQPQLKLAQLHSSANLPNLAGGCLSNRQPQFGKGG